MAYLIVREGNSEQREFALSEDVISVGRSPENPIVLDDPSASRVHAQVFPRDGSHGIRDLKSTHGTIVNGQVIQGDVPLHDGDRVRIGNSLLVYRESKPAEIGLDAALPEIDIEQEGTIAFSVPIDEAPSARGLDTQRLNVLSKIADSIQSTFQVEELLGALMDALFDLFQPDRGVILLAEDSDGRLTPRVRRPENGDAAISQTVVDYAIRQRMTLLVTDTSGDERFSDAKSILDLSIRAVICSPLICKEKVLGVLYLDTRLDGLDYREEDIALLNIISANAAIAIENAILIEEKMAAQRLAEDEPGPLFAKSAAMSAVKERISELAGSAGPVLITGERGTGKLFVAATIHRAASVPDAAFVNVDCRTIPPGEATSILFGSATFGKDDEAAAAVPSRGAVHMAAGGTLVLRHIAALDRNTQETLSRNLDTLTEERDGLPRVLLIATTNEDLNALVEKGRFLSRLCSQLSARTLEMPPLRRRKEDILPLARYFLSRCDKDGRERQHCLTPSSGRSAGQAAIPGTERRRIARGDRVRHDHRRRRRDWGGTHFHGPQGVGASGRDRPERDSVSPLARAQLGGSGPSGIRGGLFSRHCGGMPGCGRHPGRSRGQRYALGALVARHHRDVSPGRTDLVHGVPDLHVCPSRPENRNIGSPSATMAQETDRLADGLAVPGDRLERVRVPYAKPSHGGRYLPADPDGPGRGVCADLPTRGLVPLPVSAWKSLGGFSVPATLQVHSNPSICTTQCKTHECFKGSPSDPNGTATGCPVFHHPLFMCDSHFCKLCLTCLRSCPNDSARIYLRAPLQDVWRRPDLSATLTPFALVAFFLSFVMLISSKGLWGTSGAMGFSIASGLAVAAAVLVHAVLSKTLERDRDATIPTRVAFTLVILAWGPLMAFHIGHVPGLDALRIQSEPGALQAGFFSVEITLRLALQVAAVLFAGFLALVAFSRVRTRASTGDLRLSPLVWTGLVGLATVYSLGSLAILFMKGTSL